MSTTLTRKRYLSDLTDFQWANIEHLFPQGDGWTGRPRFYPLREIVNATFYLAKAGCSWRMLPHDFPPWKTLERKYLAASRHPWLPVLPDPPTLLGEDQDRPYCDRHPQHDRRNPFP